MPLSISDHRRDVAGCRYVYPVVSRRAGGVSLGVNLNPNNACNWRCVYCQVPELTRGGGPPIDLELLRAELEGMLEAILHGDYLAKNVDEPYRTLADIAISGNGEPTSSPHFVESIAVIAEALDRFQKSGELNIVLITNGSLVDRRSVQEGLTRLAGLGGEVWFKLDSVTDEGLRRINGALTSSATHLERLRRAADLCPTWIQTCLFSWNGTPTTDEEVSAYLAAIRRLVALGTPLRGVHLYGLARPSMQPEAPELAALPEDWMRKVADEIEAAGLRVQLSM